MKVNSEIRKKYCEGFDRPHPPVEIVLHATAGLGTIKWIMSGGGDNGKRYNGGIALFHYLIDQNGEVTEIINPDKWVYHSSSGSHDKETIGIEISKKNSDNSDAPTDEQYAALNELLATLKNRYPSISKIVTHDFNRKLYSGLTPKPCPGTFDKQRIATEV